jgi:hypothetical protein
MRDIMPLALLAAQLMAPKPAPARVPIWCMIAGGAAIGLCALIAIGFGVTALWLVLRPQIGSAYTALAIAGLALMLAGILGLLLRPRPAPPATVAPVALLAEAEQLIRANLVPSLLAALIAGAVTGSVVADRS